MVMEVNIYEPDKAIRQGYISLWKEMFGEIKSSKWLIWQLALRDIKAMYKQSFAGMFWAVLMPLFALGTFIVLNRAGVFTLGEIDVPYPIFAVIGLAFWQIFASGIVACTGALSKAGSMVAKINFPRESLVVSAMGRAFISFFIQIVLVIVFFFIYGFSPSWMTLFLPLMFIPILLFTLGLGLILSLINGVARDLERMIGVVMTFLLFLTPVMYAKPQSGLLLTLTKFNPVYYMVAAPRDLALNGSLSEPMGYFYSVILSIVLFIVCWMAFHLTETRVSERI